MKATHALDDEAKRRQVLIMTQSESRARFPMEALASAGALRKDGAYWHCDYGEYCLTKAMDTWSKIKSECQSRQT